MNARLNARGRSIIRTPTASCLACRAPVHIRPAKDRAWQRTPRFRHRHGWTRQHLDDRGVARMASAVILRAFEDLQHPDRQLRAEALDFIERRLWQIEWFRVLQLQRTRLVRRARLIAQGRVGLPIGQRL